MTLKELAKAYREDEKRLEKQIAALRESSKNYTGAQKHNANRHLLCLYEMKREVANTAKTLENYYTEKSQTSLYHKKSDILHPQS